MSSSRVPLVQEAEVRTAAVLGSGTMGSGIAHVAALAGLEVVLRDVDRARIDAGLARIRANLDGGVARGKVTSEARDAALARLRGVEALDEAVADADVVVEAVPEDLALKRELFAAVDRAAPPRALLATNTSSLSVAAVAAATGRPGVVVGMHFFNPVHVMKLLEVVRHDGTADEAVALAVGLGRRLGKEPIVVRDVPGFASSRLGVLLGLEAIRMLETGVARAGDIDRAMRLGYGHPMGPLELTDHVGLDVRLAIAEHLEREVGPQFRPPALLRRLVAEGRLGRKTGAGFYAWRDGKPVEE